MSAARVKCKHCKGKGKCDCGSCGVWDGKSVGKDTGLPRREYGICATCGGRGYQEEGCWQNNG